MATIFDAVREQKKLESMPQAAEQEDISVEETPTSLAENMSVQTPNRSIFEAVREQKPLSKTVRQTARQFRDFGQPIEPIENKIKQLLKRSGELQFQTFWSQYLPAHLHQTPPHTDEFPMRNFAIYPKSQNFKFNFVILFMAKSRPKLVWNTSRKHTFNCF